MFRSLALLFNFLLFLPVAYAETHTFDELAFSHEWLGLLHYQPRTLLSGYRSEAKSPDFFLTPNGPTDPRAEFEAHVLAFESESPRSAVSLQCRFPARFDFLKRKGVLSSRAQQTRDCPDLAKFLSNLGGSALSVVFSSAYPGSPPSMFGHTLLRVHGRDANGARPALSDFAINYAASVSSEENSILFAVFGLTGGYWGAFGIERYYMKVNEYANAESRDLWEYELNFTPEEVRRVLLQVWEASRGPTFKYYFFDENCSQRLLRIIMTAKAEDPAWRGKAFRFHVIPAETIRVLTEIPGAIRERRYRPSLRTKLKARLTVEDSSALEKLETELLRFQWETFRKAAKLSSDEQVRYDALLVKRAALGSKFRTSGQQFKNEQTEIEKLGIDPAPTPPEAGHGPYALGVRSGVANSLGFVEVRGRIAYHDLLNNDAGFPSFTEVNFPNVTLRYTPRSERHSLTIEQLGFVNVVSLAPWNQWEKRLSWLVDFSLSTPKDVLCQTCLAMGGEAGVGLTAGFWRDRVLLSGLTVVRGEVGSGLVTGARLIPRVTLGLLMNPPFLHQAYKTQLNVSRMHVLAGGEPGGGRFATRDQLEWNQSLSLAKNWDVRTGAKWVLPVDFSGRQKINAYREFALSLIRYF